MKYVKPAAIAATAVSLVGSSAIAGGMAEPVTDMGMAPDEVMVAPEPNSSADIIIPLILLALIAAAASGGSDSAVSTGSETLADIAR